MKKASSQEVTSGACFSFAMALAHIIRPAPLSAEPKQSDFPTTEEYAAACVKWVEEYSGHKALQAYAETQEQFWRMIFAAPAPEQSASLSKRPQGRPRTPDIDYAGVWLLKQPEVGLTWKQIYEVMKRTSFKSMPDIPRLKAMYRHAKKQIKLYPNWINYVITKAARDLGWNQEQLDAPCHSTVIQEVKMATTSRKKGNKTIH